MSATVTIRLDSDLKQRLEQRAEALVERIRQTLGHLEADRAMGRPGRIQPTRDLIVPGPPYIIAHRVRR